MSKPIETPDDNLYDGLYGDDFEDEFAVPLVDDSTAANGATEDPTNESSTEQPDEVSSPQTADASRTAQNAHAAANASSETSPLPAKPSSSASSSSVSYSAQVAQQFSSYRQTPSQERQPRFDPSRSADPSQTGGPSAATAGTNDNRPIRPSEMKDEGKMFVGGLSWDTTDEGLRNYFSEFGKVDACTIVRDPDGKSRGFAFLTFEDPASVNSVMIREHFLDGKAIDPKRAIPREEHLRNTRYFVGGLAPHTTSDSMRAFFSTFGKVVDATVMVDRETGRSKGFGFVTFEDNSNESQLVGKIGLVMDDKQIEVKTAQPRNQRDQNRQMNMRDNYNDNEGQAVVRNTPYMAPQQSADPQLYQRMMMGQMGVPYSNMMGGGMSMMGGFNPMMGMNMARFGMGNMGAGGGAGMGNMGAMAAMGGMGGMGGVNPMVGGAMGGMNPMSAGMNAGMGNVAAGMRMGMGPLGAGTGGMNAAAMGANAVGGMGVMGGAGMGMGMRQGMGMMGAGRGRGAMNMGPGPARVQNRGQHSFHPYQR
ncbi:RNA-binding domain-containing protein [Artomyces pyxidatus]|uniref:RNA-binding domain-containing protein n=1 Tax=Artomyces pyxidatus TaxID=48021 RepID=A0ACB8T5W5_9AGAM|nr:RNA-binding domain-containing protein [Artomyces pyxidatus]